MRRIRRRRSAHFCATTSTASMVFPSPTSSASNTPFEYGKRRARGLQRSDKGRNRHARCRSTATVLRRRRGDARAASREPVLRVEGRRHFSPTGRWTSSPTLASGTLVRSATQEDSNSRKRGILRPPGRATLLDPSARRVFGHRPVSRVVSAEARRDLSELHVPCDRCHVDLVHVLLRRMVEDCPRGAFAERIFPRFPRTPDRLRTSFPHAATRGIATRPAESPTSSVRSQVAREAR